MKLGLGARLAIAFALLAGLTAFVTAGVSSASTNSQVKANVDRFLRERADDIAEGRRLRPQRDDDGRRTLRPQDPSDSAIGSVLRAVESDAEVQLLDATGAVLAIADMALPVTDADLQHVGERLRPLLRTVTIDGSEYRMITQHIEGGGAVQVAQSLAETNALAGSIQTRLLLLGGVLSGIAALVGWGVAAQTTRPLRRLTESVESVANTQDLSLRVGVDRHDEIGRLAEGFDSMLSSLEASRNQQHQLVQDAAHELRTPLTSVRANIGFLERATDLEPASRDEILTSIKGELNELSVILAEVVELATESRDKAAYGPVDLADVADTALAQFELRSSRPVVRDLAPAMVIGDAAGLTRAAANLIGNAEKYSPEGSEIVVRVQAGSLSVADNGPGIAPDDRAKIFDRFFRSDQARSASGSGLGLAIVKKIAEEHGGSVWAGESLTGGAIVGFTLPEVTHPSTVLPT